MDANDELNMILDLIQQIPSIFENQYITEEQLNQKFKEVKRLQDLRDLFALGLREISDRILKGQLLSFTYEEIEKIIEARFESSSLRDSILRTIMKVIKHK